MSSRAAAVCADDHELNHTFSDITWKMEETEIVLLQKSGQLCEIIMNNLNGF